MLLYAVNCNISLIMMHFIQIRSSVRKAVVSANIQNESEALVSTLIKQFGDSRIKEELIPAVFDNDVDFIQVLVSLYPLLLLCLSWQIL